MKLFKFRIYGMCVALLFIASTQVFGAEAQPVEKDPCAYYVGRPGYAVCKDRYHKIERMKQAKQKRLDRKKAKNAPPKTKSKETQQKLEADKKKQAEEQELAKAVANDFEDEAKEIKETVEKLRLELQENKTPKTAGQ